MEIAGEFEAVQKHIEGLHSIHMLLWDAKQRLSVHTEFWCDIDGGMSEERVVEEQSCVSALIMFLNGVLSYLNAFGRMCCMLGRADDIDRRKVECAMQNLQTCSKGLVEKKVICCDEFASKDLLCELSSALSELERGMVGRRCFVELLICRYMSGFDSAGFREKMVLIDNFENALEAFWNYLCESSMRETAVRTRSNISNKHMVAADGLSMREAMMGKIDILVKSVHVSLDGIEKMKSLDLDEIRQKVEKAQEMNAKLVEMCSIDWYLDMMDRFFSRETLQAFGPGLVPIIPTYSTMKKCAVRGRSMMDVMGFFEYQRAGVRTLRLCIYTQWCGDLLVMLQNAFTPIVEETVQ